MKVVCARVSRTFVIVVLAVAVCAACSGCSRGDAVPGEKPRDSVPAETGDPVAPGDAASSGEIDDAVSELEVTTSVLETGDRIPALFAHPGVEGGANVSIPYAWSAGPVETKSYALLLVDLHPVADEWVHWMVVDIPLTVRELPEGASRIEIPGSARELLNSYGEVGYGGPEPPAGSGEHEYRATIYALDVSELEVTDRPGYDEFLDAVEGHIVARGSVSGYFGR